MSLKDKLNEVSIRWRRASVELRPSALPDALVILSEKLEQAGQENIPDINVFAADIHDRFSREYTPFLTTREIKTIARHLFTDTESGMFVSSTKILDFVLDRVENRSSTSLLRALTQAYFFGFNHTDKNEDCKKLTKVLQKCPENFTPDLLRHAQSNQFIGEEGPNQLAEIIMSSNENAVKQLAKLGFKGGLSTSAFVEVAFEEACEMVARSWSDEASFHKLLDWNAGYDQGKDILALAFPKKVKQLAHGLLFPWRSSNREPSSELQARIRNLFLTVLGDPRIEKNKWRGVDEDDRQVFIRWMNAASMRQFFDIVSETMNSPNERRMWQSRRRFWTAYLGDAQEAWVVFGAKSAQLAEWQARETGDDSFLQFAQFSTPGALSTHAVLLLRIGDLTIAEWNHVGKCRMWLSRRGTAPVLYHKEYEVFALRNNEDWETAHYGDEQYIWQRKVARQIQEYTGVSRFQID